MTRFLLRDKSVSQSLQLMIDTLMSEADYRQVTKLSDCAMSGQDLLVIATDVDCLGDSEPVNAALRQYICDDDKSFAAVQGAFMIASNTRFFTKQYAKRLAVILNRYGMFFRGHALLESVAGYKNFLTWQKVYQMNLQDVVVKRVIDFHANINEQKKVRRLKLLALHASERQKSNTYALWQLVKRHLQLEFELSELHIENGEVVDCKGCDFKTCLHYSEQESCFYGGQVTRELLPAIEQADIVVWICPNYNDAVSAMHTALINRLTVLYRRISFRDKQIYGIIVSANSGSDLVAGQLISALNFNKGFMVPPYAMLSATANDPGTVLREDDIERKAAQFARHIIDNAALC